MSVKSWVGGCRKRYERAEREFVDAKTDLHAKSEAKDLLTEHLYTVIHQNEVRKARKLAELTHKLELDDDIDVVVDAETPPPPVPLCLVMPFNQLISHPHPQPPTSPASAQQSPLAGSEQAPVGPPALPTEVALSAQQTAEPQSVSLDERTADAADAVNTPDSSGGAIPGTAEVGAAE